MNKLALMDFYGKMPDEMRDYLRHYGWHFNKKAFDFAVSLMKKKGTSDKLEKLSDPYSKDQVDELLKKQGINLENNIGYDAAYVANMIKADMWKSSIEDEAHLAKHIKDMVDDPDGSDGDVMFCWYAKMLRKGMPVYWEDIL